MAYKLFADSAVLNYELTAEEKAQLDQMTLRQLKESMMVRQGNRGTHARPLAHPSRLQADVGKVRVAAKSSQYKGVRKTGTWWQANYKKDGKQIRLGQFPVSDPEGEAKAARLYDQAVIVRDGADAVTNFWYDLPGGQRVGPVDRHGAHDACTGAVPIPLRLECCCSAGVVRRQVGEEELRAEGAVLVDDAAYQELQVSASSPFPDVHFHGQPCNALRFWLKQHLFENDF